jgi:branched-chain amino acid aminotransferase
MMENDGIRYFMINGELVNKEEANVNIAAPAIKYGVNVFEGIRGYWNKEKEELFIFRLDDHLIRLQKSCKLMRFEIKNDLIMNLRNLILDLLKANEVSQNVHIRPMVFVGGDGPLESIDPVGTAVSITLVDRWFGETLGLNCSVSSWDRISDNTMPPRIKCAANYQNSRLALMQAKLDGYDSTIILNEQGKVSEGPGYALFMVQEGIPITPRVTNNILESLTRSTVIQLFEEFYGLQTVEREIDRTELYVAEEAFFCGTGAEIAPILSIDKFKLSEGTIGRLTERLKETYYGIVRGELPAHEEWRTPLYGITTKP